MVETTVIMVGKTAVKAGKKAADEIKHEEEDAINGKGKDAGEEVEQEMERMAKQAISLGTKAVTQAVSGWGNSSVSEENDEEVEV